MIETVSVAFFTLFATIGPLDIATVFAALTTGVADKKRRLMAIRGVLIAFAILLCFAFFGQVILSHFGITLPALRTSGGILLLLIGIDLVFAKDSGATSVTASEAIEAKASPDISVFPIATPLIAGPGTIGAVILLMAQAKGEVWSQGLVILALLLNILLTLVLLLVATRLSKFLGVTGVHVVNRVMGILLSALAVQFIFDGIKQGFLV